MHVLWGEGAAWTEVRSWGGHSCSLPELPAAVYRLGRREARVPGVHRYDRRWLQSSGGKMTATWVRMLVVETGKVRELISQVDLRPEFSAYGFQAPKLSSEGAKFLPAIGSLTMSFLSAS